MSLSNTYVTFMIAIREYLRKDGSSPFSEWFNSLDNQAAARVTIYMSRIEAGNTSSLKSVGGGIYESRIDAGPGYRIYLGREGLKLVILLGGGTKKRQQKDIDVAKERWNDYKKRKSNNSDDTNPQF